MRWARLVIHASTIPNRNWITIPAGEFWMGAQKEDSSKPNHDPEAYDDRESPVHRVCLSEYQIGRYPVTVGEYRLFVEAGGYEAERFWQAGGFGEYKEPDEWEDQLAYPTRPVVECVLARSLCLRCLGGRSVADGSAVGVRGTWF